MLWPLAGIKIVLRAAFLRLRGHQIPQLQTGKDPQPSSQPLCERCSQDRLLANKQQTGKCCSSMHRSSQTLRTCKSRHTSSMRELMRSRLFFSTVLWLVCCFEPALDNSSC